MRKYFRGSSTKTNNEKVELDELLEAFNARNIVKNCWKHEHTGAEPNQTQSKLGLAVRHLKLKFDVWKVWNWRSLKLKEPKRIRSLKLNYETWHQNLKLKYWNLTMLELIWAKLSPSFSQILNWNFILQAKAESRNLKLKFEVEVWIWSLKLAKRKMIKPRKNHLIEA